MKRTQEPEVRALAPPAAPERREEAQRITLHIEELEPRLAPLSTTAILD